MRFSLFSLVVLLTACSHTHHELPRSCGEPFGPTHDKVMCECTVSNGRVYCAGQPI